MSADERLNELEVRLTLQDQVIATLDRVVREFTQRVQELELALARSRRDADGQPQPTGDPASDERPPHY